MISTSGHLIPKFPEVRFHRTRIFIEVLNFTIQISNEKLAVALYKLSNKERDVILLRYFQSMSDQEIAELYHVSRSAIYRRRSNGLKKLKTVLKERN